MESDSTPVQNFCSKLFYSTDTQKMEIQTNIVNKKHKEFSDEDYCSNLFQDTKIEIVEHPLNETDFNFKEEVKIEALKEGERKLEKLEVFDMLSYIKIEKTDSPSLCDKKSCDTMCEYLLVLSDPKMKPQENVDNKMCVNIKEEENYSGLIENRHCPVENEVECFESGADNDGDFFEDSKIEILEHSLKQETKDMDTFKNSMETVAVTREHGIDLKEITDSDQYGIGEIEKNKLNGSSNKDIISNKHVVVNLNSKDKKIEENLTTTKGLNTNKKYQCDKCGYKTIYQLCLEIHNIQAHAGKKSVRPSYPCQICNTKYNSKAKLESHIFSKHSENEEAMFTLTGKVHSCDICAYKTMNSSNFKMHLQTHKGIEADKKFQCDKCHFKTIYKHSLLQHVQNHNTSNIKKFQCDKCDFKTTWKYYLKKHIKAHAGKNVFPCQICNKIYNSKVGLDSHIVLKHSNNEKSMFTLNRKVNYCNICTYKTINTYHLKLHLRTHIDKESNKKFQCDKCNSKTPCKHYSKRHFKAHAGKNVFSCQLCNNIYITKLGLDSHIVVEHSNNEEAMCTLNRKVKSCDICTYKTINIYQLNIHRRTHTDKESDKKFKCDECDFKTRYKHSLKMHVETHVGLTSFACPVCKKKYVSKVNLDFHILSEHSDNKKAMLTVTSKVHSCDMCEYKTVKSNYLKIHLQTRHKGIEADTNFQCHQCGFKTLYKSSIIRHVQTHIRYK